MEAGISTGGAVMQGDSAASGGARHGVWVHTLTYWSYAAAAYVLMNLGEDAAMVAFMFC